MTQLVLDVHLAHGRGNFGPASTRGSGGATAAADGTVALSGTVPSYGLKMLAGEVAMGTKGVAELKNDLLRSARLCSTVNLPAEINLIARFPWNGMILARSYRRT